MLTKTTPLIFTVCFLCTACGPEPVESSPQSRPYTQRATAHVAPDCTLTNAQGIVTCQRVVSTRELTLATGFDRERTTIDVYTAAAGTVVADFFAPGDDDRRIAITVWNAANVPTSDAFDVVVTEWDQGE